jgi:glycosyltransferase involved in cell wall biosynthesis
MPEAVAPLLDIAIPVYNEGENIGRVLDALERHVRTPFRLLIAYDREDDDTLPAIARRGPARYEVRLVHNTGLGVHAAVRAAFAASTARFVIVLPADDDYNAPIIDLLVQRASDGNDIVAPSRFMRGGRMVSCPWLKSTLVRTSAFALYHVARLPTHDPSNGFRLFSRRLLDSVAIESRVGFTYSLELLVKAHRLGWTVAEVPAEWYERHAGRSRFQVLRWLPAYLRWFRYAFATTYLRRGAETVTLGRAP